jgi:hypothetical protein
MLQKTPAAKNEATGPATATGPMCQSTGSVERCPILTPMPSAAGLK